MENTIGKLHEEQELESKSGFDIESPPYILSTDFPFLVWNRFSWQGKKVLIVADSADNIITLWPLGVSRIVAVDIARKACFLNELKCAALKELNFLEFRNLFAPAYENTFYEQASPSEKKNLYLRVRDILSNAARDWLDTEIGITDFPSPSWRELMFYHLIPHFNHQSAFATAKKALSPYPVINVPIESALKNIPETFDVIYLSNIPEYIKQSLLMEEKESETYDVLEELYGLALDRLTPSGALMLYIFGNAAANPDLCSHEHRIGNRLKFSLKKITFSFSTPFIDGSLFSHTLVVIKKSNKGTPTATHRCPGTRK